MPSNLPPRLTAALCLTRAPSHPCHYSSPVVMTINHSIPHQQLLPNVTLLLIKIHPAARCWGTNDLEIGFSAPEGFPQYKMLAEEEEVTVGSKAGRWGRVCCMSDRVCLTLLIHFPEGETEALGAKLFTSEQVWRHSSSVCLDPAWAPST